MFTRFLLVAFRFLLFVIPTSAMTTVVSAVAVRTPVAARLLVARVRARYTNP